MNESPPTRTIHCLDALPWLGEHRSQPGWSFITSLPDVSETGRNLTQWTEWFVHAAALVMESVDPNGVAIFYQTDIKVEGTWVDKGFLCQLAAQRTGTALLWHKIVCRRAPGIIGYGRPSYSHMLCFSRSVRHPPSESFADVLPSTGRMTWSRAMGLAACVAACRFVRDRTGSHTVVDPFCGVGSVLAVANALGLNALGVDTSKRRCAKARSLVVSPRDLDGRELLGDAPNQHGDADGE